MRNQNFIEKQWLRQYQIQDLTRALIREYLTKHQLKQTLISFENEDQNNSKKVYRSVLVKMLCMNNLVYNNKQSNKPLESLLEVLVGYLKDKFRNSLKIGQNLANQSGVGGKKTQMSNAQNSVKDGSQHRLRIQKSLNNTFNLNKQKDKKQKADEALAKGDYRVKNGRPLTSGNRHKDVQRIYAQLDKQDIKQKQRKILIQKMKQEQQNKKKKMQEQKKRQQEKQKQLLKQRQRIEQQKKIRQIQIEKQKLRKIEQQNNKKQQQRLLKIKKLQQQKIQKQKQQRRKKQVQQQKLRQQIKKKEQQIKRKQKERIKQQQYQQQQQRKRKIEEQIKKQQQNRIRMAEIQRQKLEIQKKIISQQQKNNFILDQVDKEVKNQSKQPIKQSTRAGGMRKIGKKKEQVPIFMQQQIKIQQNATIKANSTPPQNINQSKKQNQNLQHIENKVQQQKKQDSKKMVKMFGRKKKANNQQNEESQPKKFKFDDNFVDAPLRPQGQKYEYEKIQFNKITLDNPCQPQINYRQKYVFNKKYNEKAITEQLTQQLKKVVFSKGPSTLPKSWHQGFILSPHPNTPYGLQQIQGGPCGIIAAVQCYFLKHILHLANLSTEQLSNDHIRQNCLVAAIANMLYKCKSSDKIFLALPPKSFSGTKLQVSNFRIITIDASNFTQAFEGIHQHRSYFIGKSNHGVAVLMFCIVMTKQINKILQQIDIIENPLIGNHGHCTQQLVNLFITGIASSNVFDGIKTLDSQITLKGIKQKSQFGFLTIFQTLKYIEVGKNLKNPIYPFWIICKQFHYHVIFANHFLIAQNNNTNKFDIVYFDGLYNCADRIVITLQKQVEFSLVDDKQIKIKDLPLIEQVMMTKWGKRKADWNGSIKIL